MAETKHFDAEEMKPSLAAALGVGRRDVDELRTASVFIAIAASMSTIMSTRLPGTT